MMWVISFIFIVVYSRSIGRFSSWNWMQVPIERIIFISAFLSFVRCLDVGDMFGQDVNASSGRRSMQYNELSGTISTTKHGIFRPHLLSEVYRMILVQESLIICQFFEQQAKLSSDMLHPLLTFHCSSRDSLTCEHMVKNWCDIAFLTEHIRNRSP